MQGKLEKEKKDGSVGRGSCLPGTFRVPRGQSSGGRGGMFSRYRKGPLGFHLKKTNDGAAKSLEWPGLRVSVEGVRPKTNLRGLRHEPNPYEIATSDCMHGRQM